MTLFEGYQGACDKHPGGWVRYDPSNRFTLMKLLMIHVEYIHLTHRMNEYSVRRTNKRINVDGNLQRFLVFLLGPLESFNLTPLNDLMTGERDSPKRKG